MNNVQKNILQCDRLSAKEKLKALIYYYSRKRGAIKSWQDRHQKVFELHSSYNKPCTTEVESSHQELWSDFRQKVDMSTLRICKNLSEQADQRIIPEDIFVSDIEPTLMADESGHFLSHKSFYNRWFPDGVFPKDFFHCIDGQYMDAHLNPISFNELVDQARAIPYPVVMKPNKDSYGGKGVLFIKNSEKLVALCKANHNFVVQEQINQHSFFQKYNPVGLNTIRVYIYKSVKDNVPHVLNMALRMGKGGSLDNETSGGIHTRINEKGFMNGYAVDKYGQRFTTHPDTGLSFDGEIPAYDELKELALNVSEQVYFTRIIGLDACYDSSGRWRIIEINTKGHAVRFAQYGGHPFLGKFTGEVIEYCKKNHWTLNKNL